MPIGLDYLAGFFDGEGSISAVIRRRKNRPNPGFLFAITATNVDRTPLEGFRDHFGGSIYNASISTSKRVVFRWQLSTGRDLLSRFVQDMDGRLYVKAAQLAVVKRFLNETTSMQRGPRAMDADELAQRRWYFEEVRRLNLRLTGSARLLRAS